MDELNQKIANYAPSDETVQLIHNTKVLFLVGPAGAGKDTIKERLLADPRYRNVVSHTTRAPRLNHGELEVDGRDYHFVDTSEAKRMIDAQEFVEIKQVHGGNLYGTSAAELKIAHDNQQIALNDIEVQGVAEFKAIDQSVMPVFLLPPSFDDWQERLQLRYGEMVEENDYIKRMRTAIDELQVFLEAGYYIGVVNDSIDATVEHIKHIAEGEPQTEEEIKAAQTLAQSLLAATQAKLEQI
jgi:guanylate kinase